MDSLKNAKVGDKIRVLGSSVYQRNINEVRTVARVLKTMIVDNAGIRWSKIHGCRPGDAYPTTHAELITDSQGKE